MSAVRTGYKETEIGLLPVDWDVKALGECAAFRTGPFGSALHKSDYTLNGVPVVNPMHIVDGDIMPSRAMTITEAAASALSDFRLCPGEVVIGRRGDMGRCAVVQEPHRGWLCGTGSMIIRPFSVDSEFLQRVVSSPRAVAAIVDASVGTTMVNINQETLRRLPIQSPSLSEQRRISQALSDVDALLAGLDRLIAKKRDIKQAAMQQLLTGQTRLRGFHDSWESKRLGEIGTFLKGSGVRKDEANSGDRPCIRYGEIYTHHHNCIKEFSSWISAEVAFAACRLKQGDLLFAGSGETKKEIGKCVAYLHSAEAYAGGDIVIFRPFAADAAFMGYYCNTGSINAQKAGKGQGDAVVHISAAALSSIELALPTVAEQNAIATVLLDMDAELAALEVRRSKTRTLKQAMMQELLTGRIRLI